MRVWDDLNYAEKKLAKSVARGQVLQRCIEFPPEYLCGNSEDLLKRYDRAVKDMERLQTPWFLAERLLEDYALKRSFEELLNNYCEIAFYPGMDEPIVYVNWDGSR